MKKGGNGPVVSLGTGDILYFNINTGMLSASKSESLSRIPLYFENFEGDRFASPSIKLNWIQDQKHFNQLCRIIAMCAGLEFVREIYHDGCWTAQFY